MGVARLGELQFGFMWILLVGLHTAVGGVGLEAVGTLVRNP
jgi:hypothetical protein